MLDLEPAIRTARLSKPFPTTPDELTAEWLGAITGHRVDAFEVGPLGEGVGVIGSVNRVLLTCPGGPGSLIVKFSSRAPENRAVALTYDMYRREVHFYRELAARVPIRTPRCYAAEYDDARDDFVLVLEDLRDCRVGDQVAGASLADAEAVVDTLASLHAATWNRPLEGVRSHNFPAQRDGIAQGFQMGWPVVMERFPELIPEAARRRAPALASHIGTLIDTLTASSQCLVHADVRLDNVLFVDAAPGAAATSAAPVLVDWQSVCLSSGEQDLAYFLTQSLADDVREQHLDELIRRYHQVLTDGGVAGHTLDACRQRFRVASVYLLAWAVLIAGTLDLGNERGQALARALLGRSFNAVMSLDGFDLLT